MLLVLVAAIVMPGCGLTIRQEIGVRKFATASIAMSQLATNYFTDSRAQVIAMNTQRVRLGDSAIAVDPTATAEVNETALAGLIQEKHLASRLAAMTALRTYATLLTELAGDVEADALQVSVDRFLTSLERVDTIHLSNDRRAAVGGLITQAAAQWVDQQRADALRAIVIKAEPWVVQVIELLKRDVEAQQEQWLFAYLETVRQLEQAATIAEATTDATPADITQARLMAQQHRAAHVKTAARLHELCDALRLAQVNLRGAMQSQHVTPDDLDTLLDRAQSAVEAITIIRSGN